MSTPDKNQRAFISHSSEDAEQARKICDLLEEQGIPCWIAPRNVAPGKAYGEEIIHAIESCDVLILVLSSRSNASNAVTSEVERAFSKKKLIIPIRIEDVFPARAIEFFVASAQWVDAWHTPLKAAVAQVATAVKTASDSSAPLDGISHPAATSKPEKSIKSMFKLGVAAALLGILASVAWLYWQTPDAERGSDSPNGSDNGVTTLPRYHALVIGINDYPTYGGEGWTPLKTARNDAASIADILETQYGFKVSRLFDKDASRARILQALDAMVSLEDSDALLIYFAGHGYYDKATSEGYWIPSDARKQEGSHLAKEGWIWNSTLDTIFGACGARHVFVVADACYAGALFRGDDINSAKTPELVWYRRAIQTPSRYLLASGDLEPVLDTGAQHSAFAQQVLSFLSDRNNMVFSASDIGLHVRNRVGQLTGQMVRMGPLKSPRNAGGEFVFVRKGATLGDGSLAPPLPLPSPENMNIDQRSEMTSALALARSGATNSARRVVREALNRDADSRLARAVESYLSETRQSNAHETLQSLIETLEKRKPSTDANTHQTRPRILACLGPDPTPGSSINEDLAQLYRICLRSELEGLGRSIVVEREAIQAVLQEMNLGTSNLADSQTKLAIGKLLPAGLLLIGNIIPQGADSERLFMRIVDTETTRVLASVSDARKADEDPYEPAVRLAHALLEKAVELKPLEAQARKTGENRLTADVGTFHTIQNGMVFNVEYRKPDGAKEPIGKATVDTVSKASCNLTVEWIDDAPPSDEAADQLWIREMPL